MRQRDPWPFVREWMQRLRATLLPGRRDADLSLVQTKGAVRLLRAYGSIGSRATKYALVVAAEALVERRGA